MKFTLSCIVICIHLCLARHTGTNKNGLRIKGGRNATEDEFPYVVKLMLQSLTTRKPGNERVCSGIVLASKWTLTAGHCVNTVEEELQQQLSAGVIKIKPVIEYQASPKAEVTYSEVTSMSKPSGAGTGYRTMRNDIGLLHTQPVFFAKYGKLSPIDYAALTGQAVSIVGYGIFKKIWKELPFVPQVIDVVVKECPGDFNYPQMCFAPSCSARGSVCSGDSGGPVVHASGVIAVVSAVDYRNCFPDLISSRDRYSMGYEIGVSTPISPFVDWISTVMRTETDTKF